MPTRLVELQHRSALHFEQVEPVRVSTEIQSRVAPACHSLCLGAGDMKSWEYQG